MSPQLQGVGGAVPLEEAVVGDKEQAEEGQGQQLGGLYSPEDPQLQHEVGGGEGGGGHHGPCQGDEGGAQEHQDAPGEDFPQGGVLRQPLAAPLGGAQEEHGGKAGEHHGAGEAGQQPEEVGQHHPGPAHAHHRGPRQQVRPLLFHGQEGAGQQRPTDAGPQAQDQHSQGRGSGSCP